MCLLCTCLCMFGCVMVCGHLFPTNTIPLWLICPKAIIKLFVCAALSLSLVIDFYKYSISLTSSQTPTFQKNNLATGYIIYFCALFVQLSFPSVLCTFYNVSLCKIKPCFILQIQTWMCCMLLNVDTDLEVYINFLVYTRRYLIYWDTGKMWYCQYLTCKGVHIHWS